MNTIDPTEAQLIEAEEQLRMAMLNADVNILDKLLADDLVFTNHLGQVLGKQDDLAAHQSGKFKIEVLIPYEKILSYSCNFTRLERLFLPSSCN